MFDATARRREQIEQLRRSVSMLQPGAHALDREDAMRLLGELARCRADWIGFVTV